MPVRLSRVRRQIAYLKAVLRDNDISLPQHLIKLPKRVDPWNRKQLQLCRRQERELRAFRDRMCPFIQPRHQPPSKSRPVRGPHFIGGGLPSLGKRR